MIPFISILFVILGVVSLISIHFEDRDFNDGICKRCGNRLKHVRYVDNDDYDDYGGREYRCDECGYTTWVSWDSVDEDYI